MLKLNDVKLEHDEYYLKGNKLRAGLLMLIIGAIGIGGLVFVWLTAENDDSILNIVFPMLIALYMIAVTVVWCIFWKQELIVNRTGVTSKSLFRTKSISWQDVKGIEIEHGHRGVKQIVFETDNGPFAIMYNKELEELVRRLHAS